MFSVGMTIRWERGKSAATFCSSNCVRTTRIFRTQFPQRIGEWRASSFYCGCFAIDLSHCRLIHNSHGYFVLLPRNRHSHTMDVHIWIDSLRCPETKLLYCATKHTHTHTCCSAAARRGWRTLLEPSDTFFFITNYTGNCCLPGSRGWLFAVFTKIALRLGFARATMWLASTICCVNPSDDYVIIINLKGDKSETGPARLYGSTELGPLGG